MSSSSPAAGTKKPLILPATDPVGPNAAPLASASLFEKTPGLRRRLAAFVYEGVLLFGVTMAAGFLYSTLTQQRHALHGKVGMQAFLFVVLAVYFSGFWSRGGQTVAMKAWQIRLVTVDGKPVSQWQALLRYLLAWLWFLPALAASYFAGLQGMGAMMGMMIVGVLAYASLAWLRPDRQYWHDVVCRTRLVHWHPPLPLKSKSGA